MSKAPPMDEYELELIKRLLALHADRLEKLKLVKSPSSSYEELSKINQDISRINDKLREQYGY